MANVSYKLKDLEKRTIKIGYVGENDHMHVLIDCKEAFDEYPNAVATMAIVPPEGENYPKAVTRNGNIVEWLVKNSDVAAEGDGEFQLTFTEDNVVKKSVTGRFSVERSISGSGTAPSGIDDFLTDANEKLAAVEAATQEAEDAASHAPRVGTSGYWETWDAETGAYVSTGTKAQGEQGDPGSPGDPTQLIDDTAGQGTTGKTWSANKLDDQFGSVLSGIQGLENCFVAGVSESATLQNYENATSFKQADEHSTGNMAISDGVVSFTPSATTTEVNPYIRHSSLGFGTKKWLIGFKYKVNKLNNSVSDYTRIRILLGGTEISEEKTWNEWKDFSYSGTLDLYRIYLSAYGFTTAPVKNDISIQIKDIYVYDVSDVSNGLCDVIISAQNENYTDGTVTYYIENDTYSTDKTLSKSGKSADSKTVGDLIGGVPSTKEFEFSYEGYIDNSGELVSSNTSISTDYIDLEDGMKALAYTGVMGSNRCVHWYNSEKTYLSMSIYANDVMQNGVNILAIKPDNAKYARLSAKSANNHEAIAYYGENYTILLMNDIVGDGVTDDTEAFQKLVSCGNGVKLNPNQIIRITESIVINPAASKEIDGNGAMVIVDGDFYAFSIKGTQSTSSNPNNVSDFILKKEAATVIKNFRITSADGESGGGIQTTDVMKLNIFDNFIFKMKNGIRFYGVCRDMMICRNHIYALMNDGLLFDTSVNIHQCNIENNIINYALNCIHIHNPQQIANFQIVGNDIEISTYPTGYNQAACIFFDVDGVEPSQFSEVIISGNTIQGHATSGKVIKMVGDSTTMIGDVSIVGNHISNSFGCIIYLENCVNVAISGNTYKEIGTFVYELHGTIKNLVIIGETAQGTVDTGGKMKAVSTSVLENVICKYVICTPYGTNSILTSSTTNVDVT